MTSCRQSVIKVTLINGTAPLTLSADTQTKEWHHQASYWWWKMRGDNVKIMLDNNKISSARCWKEIPQLRVFHSDNFSFRSKRGLKMLQWGRRLTPPRTWSRGKLHPAGTIRMQVGFIRLHIQTSIHCGKEYWELPALWSKRTAMPVDVRTKLKNQLVKSKSTGF